ncbi:uncharacterized protein LOC129565659 [Sitodiplosis mosellana]|uniref:uncharacterized protein LOC129565659 n=1 Tax=Sitodiplosis mosellana TaxID=263140 RepID=UPI0024445AD0|nr:uncharacterized protein LOC129565659 [Sitodiplosis mosellana]
MALLTESWAIDILTILIGALTLVYLFFKRTYTYWERKGIKVLPGKSYLFGHFSKTVSQKEFVGNEVKGLYDSTNEPFIGIYSILRPILLVRNTDLIRSILIKDFTHFTDRGVYCNVEYDPLSGHLFALPGDSWKKLRSKLTPAFTSGKLKAIFSTLLDCGSTLQNYLEKLVDKNELLDAREIAACYTTNVTASVAFGIDVDTINDPNNDFRVCGRKIFSINIRNIIRSFLFFNAPQIMKFLMMKVAEPEVETFLRMITKQNLEYREQNNVSRKDIFQLLVQLRNTGTIQLDDQWDTVIETDQKQKTLTEDEIAAQTFVFFLAGYETSSTTLSFCLYELAKNLDVQQRVHSEIDEILLKHDGKLTYESISEMKLLEACMDETLRKYPVLPLINRQCVKEYQIPGTNHIIEKGVHLYIPVLGLQMDEKYYEEPEKFIPDRFIDENSAGKNISNKPYLPFGDGPRNCIGMRLGKLQTKVGLVMMLQKFRYELTEKGKNTDMEFDPKFFFIMPLAGINLHVSKRNMAILTSSWTVDFLALLIGALTVLYLIIKRNYSYWERKGFKTLPGFNHIVGHFKKNLLGKESLADFSTRLYRSTNEAYIGIYGLMRPMLLVRDPELLRLIMIKDFTHFTDRGLHSNEEYDPLSGHLFVLPGQKWKNLRGKLTPTFTSGKLKSMFSTLLDCGSTLQNYLEKLANKGEMLDVREISAAHSTNVIASVAFGIDVDTINDPNNDFRKYGRKIFESNFWNNLKGLIGFVAPKLMSFLRLKAFDADVEKFIMSVVKQNLEYREKNNVSRKDFFQLLIQLRNTGSVQLDDQWDTVIKADETQKTMTLNEIAAQTFVFFAAGFETSSTTLSFCLYELAKDPKIQQRVHEEIDIVLNQHNGQITYVSISDMKYLEACIDETLRKYPVVPLLQRECVKDYPIPGTDKVIEKGVEIFIPAFAIQHDQKYYENPEKFDPERFNEENSAGKNIVNRPYIPFGVGPRNCIGLRMGKMQTKVGLVLMLQKYRFELEERLKKNEFKFDPHVFLLSPLGGINLHIIKR